MVFENGDFVSLWIFTIALSGQAVLNDVVKLSGFEQLQNARPSVVEAVKPGLMTAMLAALGLLPIALSHDICLKTQRALAIVIIGGMVTATLLTLVVLVVLPALYVPWFGKEKKLVAKDEAAVAT